MTNDRRRCVVLGIGNADRGDDAAGPAVARQLGGLKSAGVEIIEHSGEATALITQMEGAERVFLIDACASGAQPGTIHCFDVNAAPVPAVSLGLSTHGFGLAAAVELARALGQLPPRCVIYAIEGASFETGAPLSPPVAAAVADVVRRLRAEIASDANRGDSRTA
jgi:hydrogenase maturation protease